MRRPLLTLLLVLLAAPAAVRAAAPIDQGSPHGVMMLQAMHTLGAQEAACPAAAAPLATSGAQVTCAQVPGSMYGFFREAVHGRLYEYLARKTLAVVADWSTQGDLLSVRYAVDGGTLTVTRLRADGVLYAVFVFVPPARAAGPAVDRRGEAAAAASPAANDTAAAGDAAQAAGSGMQP